MFLKDKKIKHFNLIPIIVITIALIKVVNEPQILANTLSYISSIFTYLIWAFAIAFLLNPLMVFLEKRCKVNRIISILIIYMLFVSIIIFTIIIITPILANNIAQLINNLPQFVDNTQKWFFDKIKSLKADDTLNIYTYIKDNVSSIFEGVKKYLGLSLTFVFQQAVSITSIIIKLLLGLLISIYLLNDKEKLILTLKKSLYAFFKVDTVNNILKIGNKVNIAFTKYLIAKIIGSAIIGLLCFLGLLVLRIPFALLISIIVGITNLIPYIGGFVGMIPSVIIIFLIDPIKALWTLGYLLLLQQLDSWVVSPKIIGEKTGLTPLLIITALTIGGAIYGILGMFLSIPLVAVLREFYNEYIEKRLESRNIDQL